MVAIGWQKHSTKSSEPARTCPKPSRKVSSSNLRAKVIYNCYLDNTGSPRGFSSVAKSRQWASYQPPETKVREGQCRPKGREERVWLLAGNA